MTKYYYFQKSILLFYNKSKNIYNYNLYKLYKL